MHDLTVINRLTQDFAAANAELSYLGQSIDAAVADLKREFAARYRAISAKVAERHSKLATAIQESPGLFEKPRTLVIAGVNVGLAKGKGGIVYGDPDDVVRRIEKLFGDDAEQYLHVRKSPDKEAIEKLTVCELGKIGCTLVDTGDKVVIKPLEGEMSTLARNLLKTLAEEANS